VLRELRWASPGQTSENTFKAKFAEITFHALGRIGLLRIGVELTSR
jgi:hypothetical protein